MEKAGDILINEMTTKGTSASKRMCYSHGNDVKEMAIQNYHKEVEGFLGQLMWMIHLTSGQPARRPEVLSLRWKNTQEGHRNIILWKKHVCLLVDTHKTAWLVGPRAVLRALPPWLGNIVVKYLAVVRPFAEACQILLEKGPAPLPATSATLFAKHPLTTDLIPAQKLTDVCKAQTTKWFDATVTIRMIRHIMIAFMRHYGNQERIDRAFGRVDAADDEDDETADLQASHSTAIARAVYANEFGNDCRKLEDFFQCSLEWHAIVNANCKKGSRNSLVEDDPSQENAVRRANHNALNLADMEAKFRQLSLMKAPQLHDHQKEVMIAVKDYAKPSVLYISATGSGKSMVFMLPASIHQDGMTIVIQPTRALQRDTAQRLEAMGISVWRWMTKSMPQPTQLPTVLLVTPEGMGTAEWDAFRQWDQFKRAVTRVVLDECQEVILTDSCFRPAMERVGEQINKIQVPVIYMTGTLPISMEDTLIGKLQIQDSRTDLRIIRSTTTRKNLAFGWIQEEASMDRVKELLGKLDKGDKALVYVESVAMATDWGEQLGGASYVGGDKGQTFQQEQGFKTWSREGGVMVATTALGVGIDVPGVVLVICCGDMFNGLTMIQMFGRAGRDGSPATAVLICTRGKGEKKLGDRLQKEWSTGCLRQAIGRYLDGDDAKRCGFNDNRCQRCLVETPGAGAPTGYAEKTSAAPPQRTPHHDARQTATQMAGARGRPVAPAPHNPQEVDRARGRRRSQPRASPTGATGGSARHGSDARDDSDVEMLDSPPPGWRATYNANAAGQKRQRSPNQPDPATRQRGGGTKSPGPPKRRLTHKSASEAGRMLAAKQAPSGRGGNM